MDRFTKSDFFRLYIPKVLINQPDSPDIRDKSFYDYRKLGWLITPKIKDDHLPAFIAKLLPKRKAGQNERINDIGLCGIKGLQADGNSFAKI